MLPPKCQQLSDKWSHIVKSVLRRFPYLLSIGVTAEIMQGLEAGTHNGLFSISDSARGLPWCMG
jgi:hypothetical protein